MTVPFFPSLRPEATVSDLYRAHRPVYMHWIRMGQEVMSADGPLTQGERELIATYVSCLNHCEYCREAHLPELDRFGIKEDVVDALLEDIETAPVEERFKPLYRFVRKLTLEPAAVGQADADAVYAAGWTEEALDLAISVTCRFAFMNRLVLSHGLVARDFRAARASAKQGGAESNAPPQPQAPKKAPALVSD
jgi:uncharacterized peroxidase-related enzyme